MSIQINRLRGLITNCQKLNNLIFGNTIKLMASEKSVWFKRSDIGSALIVAAILWIIGIVRVWYTSAPILKTVNQWLELAGNGILIIANYQIKFWWLVTAILIFKFSLFGYHRNKHKDARIYLDDEYDELTELGMQEVERQNIAFEKRERNILAYKADKFFNVTWEWIWVWNKKINVYEAKKITPCCPNPDCDLSQMTIELDYGYQTSYKCGQCRGRITVPLGAPAVVTSIEGKIMEKVANF